MLLALLLLSSVTVMAQESDERVVSDSVDAKHVPSFPGGVDAMDTYLHTNAKYPVNAAVKGIQGQVTVDFCVDKDGTISETNVENPIDSLLAEEAMRVVRSMPKWTPGYFRGNPVSVRCSLSFEFILTGNEGNSILFAIKFGLPEIKSEQVTHEDPSETFIDENLRLLRQEREVSEFDNNSFFVTYFNGRNVYNSRGVCIVRGNDSVVSLRNCIAIRTMLILYRTSNGHQYAVKVDVDSCAAIMQSDIDEYNGVHIDKCTAKKFYYDDANLIAACYRSDARQMAIGRDDKRVIVFHAVNDTVVSEFSSSIVPRHMVYSDNGYFLVLVEGKNVEVWNMDNGTVRKSLTMNANVNDVAFADNCRKMMVATADGSLTVYETTQFKEVVKVNGLGTAKCCRAIGSGKYVAVLTSDKTASIVNLLATNDVTPLNTGLCRTTNIGIGIDVSGNPCLVFNSRFDGDYNFIGYYRVQGLSPYYKKMIESELISELNLWMKKMPNETLEEYTARVNEDSRSEKAHQLAIQIATRMAESVLENPVMTLGGYNKNTGQLALHIEKMPDIYMTVPSDEIVSLANLDSNVKLRNVKYMLNDNDLFEVAYAEVVNPVTNKVYVYDKMKTEPMALSQLDDLMVPLDIVMKTNMEEVSLMNIKDEVVNLAKQEQLISDNTHISVVTQVSRGVSADGKDILNYDINFTYEVDQKFSTREDFKAGRFHTEESGAAISMLKIMKMAFETGFAKYIQEGKKVNFSITGSADASPILRTIAYDGVYGEYLSEPVYKENELTNLTLTKERGISDNYQLAFARAIGVQHYLEKELDNFKRMKRYYDYHIDVSKEEGSQYRRISVQCSFIDAF